MNILKYAQGMGQAAKELPPEHKCYTEAEVERIVSRVINDIEQEVTQKIKMLAWV